MKMSELEAICKVTSRALKEYVARMLEPALERLDALERRSAELESRQSLVESKSMTYEGVWKDGVTYEPGAAVTHQGGVWVTRTATRTRPGTGDVRDWVLAVKSGQNGRDADGKRRGWASGPELDAETIVETDRARRASR